MSEDIIEMLVVDRCVDEVLQRRKLMKVTHETCGI